MSIGAQFRARQKLRPAVRASGKEADCSWFLVTIFDWSKRKPHCLDANNDVRTLTKVSLQVCNTPMKFDSGDMLTGYTNPLIGKACRSNGITTIFAPSSGSVHPSNRRTMHLHPITGLRRAM